MIRLGGGASLLLIGTVLVMSAVEGAVRVKNLVRVDGAIDSQLMGYGLVIGLAGTGDSERSLATTQSVANMLREFGVQVPVIGVRTRNVAAVMVTANAGHGLRPGDRFDVMVSAMADARSLAGGTLIMTPLLGADRRTYAMAQGPVTTDSFRFEQDGALAQKNHPTAGTVSAGALSQLSMESLLVSATGTMDLLLLDPDYTTAVRIASAITGERQGLSAYVHDAGRVRVQLPDTSESGVALAMAAVENVTIQPDLRARVVVNERTGTVVAGGDVSISGVTVTQGDIRVAISRRNLVSQPGGVLIGDLPGVRTAVVPESRIVVEESEARAVTLAPGSTVADLVASLQVIRASPQDVVAVLQGISRAGALHAELIVQ